MEVGVVVERVRQIASVRDDGSAGRESIEAALRAGAQLRAWLAKAEADLTRLLAPQVSFPEKAIADCTRTSLGEAVKATERAETLAAVPEFADALDTAAVTAAHVDAITRAGKGLDDEQRGELYERVAGLVDVAAVATVREFGKRLDARGALDPARRRSCQARAATPGDAAAHLDRRRGHVVPVGPFRSAHRGAAVSPYRWGGAGLVRRGHARHLPQ